MSANSSAPRPRPATTRCSLGTAPVSSCFSPTAASSTSRGIEDGAGLPVPSGKLIPMADPTPGPPATRRVWLRRLRWPAGVLLGLLLVLYVLLPLIARPIVRGKLQRMVRSHLDADLKISRLSY